MPALHILSPSDYPRERAYIYDVLFREFLGIEYTIEVSGPGTVEIRIRGTAPVRSLRFPDIFFRLPEADWLTPRSLPKLPLVRVELPPWLGQSPSVESTLPLLFGGPPPGAPLALKTEVGFEVAFDLFGSCFFLLARLEELIIRERDNHGRFQSTHSLVAREGLLERPLVNEYLELLWRLLDALAPGLHRRPRKRRILLTHDVDRPWVVDRRSASWVLKNIAADLLIRGDLPLAARRARTLMLPAAKKADADPANTFDLLMDLSETLGVTSTFYFICGTSDPAIDANYTLRDPWIRALMTRIHRRGHEVGIHGSYETHANQEQFQKEARELRATCAELDIRQEAFGGRQHYLRWSAPTTWQIWEEAGMSYDSSLGFADQPGFRCGTCYEFPVFNALTGQALKLRERPLLVMDVTLLGRRSTAALEEATRRIHRVCQTYQGDLTLLWHNNNLMSRIERRGYQRILDSFAGQ